MPVNGLYGHVSRNDARSLLLFAGFVLAFHLLAMLALLLPLAMHDPEHAPLYGWTGYFIRWVPVVTIVGALLFAVQMAWHVRTIRRRTEFRFVDDQDEPRLCRIVEPLTIAAGLPTPYVAVIDSPALNAFACGIRQKDAVLVFTKGLIDALDDDELAAVAAHEIMHVVNGDIRLIAATNVCLDTLSLLQPRSNWMQANRISQALALPVLALVFPIMVVLILIFWFLHRLAHDGSHLVRLLIASAREFIADAEAVRLTQNPAALVSALQRIEGRSAIPGLAAGQDAMMIDGAHKGAFATHPTIAERIAAIVSVTGSMALIAPARRDTRPQEIRAAASFGRRSASAFDVTGLRGSLREASLATSPASFDANFNRLGLTREMTVGAVAAICLFLWAHSADLTRPSALVRALDPGSLRTFFAAVGEGARCQRQGIGGALGLRSAPPAGCDQEAIENMLAARSSDAGILVTLMKKLQPDIPFGPQESGVKRRPNGTFSNVPTADEQIAEVRRARCFQTDSYTVGDRGLHYVTEVPKAGETISLPRYLDVSVSTARLVNGASSPAGRDAMILQYFKNRKSMGEVIHRFFGEPGLMVATTAYANSDHQAAIAVLRQRLADPGFGSALTPLERAEIEVLASDPLDFVSCTARRGRPGKDA
ncbi:M48 family metalloprotease [Bradyrhizobium sp. UFLA05-112]